jgi:hypothetical protein
MEEHLTNSAIQPTFNTPTETEKTDNQKRDARSHVPSTYSRSFLPTFLLLACLVGAFCQEVILGSGSASGRSLFLSPLPSSFEMAEENHIHQSIEESY